VGTENRISISRRAREIAAEIDRLPRLKRASVLRREAADRGPIKGFTPLREQPEKSVVQKTAERHGTRRDSAAAKVRRMSLNPSGAANLAG